MRITVDLETPAGVTDAEFIERAGQALGWDPESEDGPLVYVVHELAQNVNVRYSQGVRMAALEGAPAAVDPTPPRGKPEPKEPEPEPGAAPPEEPGPVAGGAG